MSTRPTILIVDDEESIRISLELALSDAFHPILASTAEEALQIALRTTVGVALIDITLGGKSGVWLLTELKTNCPMCEIIMITADHTLEKVIECYSLGAYGYIPKPYNNEELKWLVRRASEKHRLTRKNAFLLTRIMKQPKIAPLKSQPVSLNFGHLIAPISKRLGYVNDKTLDNLDRAQNELKRQVLTIAMHSAGWNQVHAAKLLGIKRTTLRQKLEVLGIAVPAQHGRPQV